MNNSTETKIKKIIEVVTYRLHIIGFYPILSGLLKTNKINAFTDK